MARLTAEQMSHFEEFGFLKIENLIDPEKIIDPIVDEYHTVLSNLADELYNDILFTLWKRHVMQTGETYYPPMQKELLIEFELLEEEEIAD